MLIQNTQTMDSTSAPSAVSTSAGGLCSGLCFIDSILDRLDSIVAHKTMHYALCHHEFFTAVLVFSPAFIVLFELLVDLTWIVICTTRYVCMYGNRV